MRRFHFIESTVKSWQSIIKFTDPKLRAYSLPGAKKIAYRWKTVDLEQKVKVSVSSRGEDLGAAERQVTEGHGFLSSYSNGVHMFKCSFQIIDHNVEICMEHDELNGNIWTPLVFPWARSTPGHSHPHLPESSSRHWCLDRHVSKGLSCSLLGPQCLVQCQVHHSHSVRTWWMNECWMNSSVSQTCRKRFINSTWQVKNPLTFLHLLGWESCP